MIDILIYKFKILDLRKYFLITIFFILFLLNKRIMLSNCPNGLFFRHFNSALADTTKEKMLSDTTKEKLPITGDTTIKFTPEQDSTFQQKLFDSSKTTLFQKDFTYSIDELSELVDSLNNTPQAIMKRNLTFNPNDLKPDARDMMRRQEDIRRSLYGWDDKRPQAFYPLQISISMGSIGRFFGVIEDVTPRIKYILTKKSFVSVKVYDHTAKLVRTLVNSYQTAGSYSFDWNLKDDNNKKVAIGDYIAEIIIDGQPYKMNKRIEVP